jgi:alpha-D-xyloside xylohydrolase
MWNFGEQTYQTQLKFDRVRYRLLPYIYSLAGEITQRAGTMMRPLVMDFRADDAVWEIWDQYLFGPALMVSPVTDYQARSRNVYLPQTAGGWYDFWTGTAEAGGQTLDAPAPYDSIPVFVRAGSIIPTGPELEFTEQAPADPITLFVYAGADGSFTLYEDDGLSYGYEDGSFSEIPLSYDDTAGVLTIGTRSGEFPGMLAERTFRIVLVSAESGVGFDPDATAAGIEVAYDGSAADVVVQ